MYPSTDVVIPATTVLMSASFWRQGLVPDPHSEAADREVYASADLAGGSRGLNCVCLAPSSRGLGHHPLKVEARVRTPLGLPKSAGQTTDGEAKRTGICCRVKCTSSIPATKARRQGAASATFASFDAATNRLVTSSGVRGTRPTIPFVPRKTRPRG